MSGIGTLASPRKGPELMDVRMKAASAATRRFTAFRRRRSRLRHAIPSRLVRQYARTRSRATELRKFYLPVRHRSRFQNVFHCCIQKTGSQWMMAMLSDPATFAYSGLSHYHYQSRDPVREVRNISERSFPDGFRPGAIVSPLYITYDNFAAMPKPEPYRAFFVMRDPRDLIASWYFSTRSTHILALVEPGFTEARATLLELSEEDGLCYAIDRWEEKGGFAALRSWAERGSLDENVRIVRYEDLVASGPETMADLLAFLDIRLPADQVRELVDAYSFRRLSGRSPGTEDRTSHMRSGRAGDWESLFTPRVAAHFASVAGDLTPALGYTSPRPLGG